MIMASPLSTLSHTSRMTKSLDSHLQHGNSATQLLSRNDVGLAQLISNLDHDIPTIRMRALKNLQEKLDHGLITVNVLSKRVDLMHRLSCWLRSIQLTEIELHLIIKFLSHMSKDSDFRNNFLRSQVTRLLAVEKLVAKPDTKIMYDELLRSAEGSFDINISYKGSPAYDDNTATPRLTSRSTTYRLLSSPAGQSTSGRKKEELIVHERMEKGQGEGEGDFRSATPREFYFNKRVTMTKGRIVEFGLPTLSIQATDRRVLVSTTESILSKDEQLVFLTTCFIRDVLLNDFPAEVFIQESGLSLGLLQVVEESWNNERLNYSAFQTLLKLSNLLRSRFAFLNKIDYYDQTRTSGGSSIPRHASATGYRSSRQSPYMITRDSNNDYFMSNLSQLLKAFIRGLNFKSNCTSLWILLSSYCLTFSKCYHLFGRSNTLALMVQEILLELSQFFLKYSRFVNPPVLATSMSSLLSCLQSADSIILSTDIRHAIWNLAAKTNLKERSPRTLKRFIENARAFQSGLDDILVGNVEPQPPDSEFAFNRVYDEWWRFEKPDQFRVPSNESTGPCDPQSTILNSLYAIQNATKHSDVENGLDSLREFTITLWIDKSSRTAANSGTDNEVVTEQNLSQWQAAFDKFILVEPSCEEDEYLLVKVLDFLSSLISWLEDAERIRSWIQPKTTEKGSALLRVLMQNCLNNADANGSDATILRPILRSLFDFYFVMLFGNGHKSVSAEIRWDFLQLLVQALERIAVNSFNSSACLHCVLAGLVKLTAEQVLIAKLSRENQLHSVLLNSLVETIYVGQQSAGPESFRNSATIYYAATSILHLVSSSDASSQEWNPMVTIVLPLMWESSDATVRTVAFQICEIFSRTSSGTSALLSRLESPAILWTTSYSCLTNPRDVPTVRQAAGSVIINLINSWESMQRILDPNLQVPKWKILQDLTTLLCNVYWHEDVSRTGPEGAIEDEAKPEGAGDAIKPLITPKTLATIARLAKAAINSSDNNSSAERQSNEVILRHISKMLLSLIGDHDVNTKMSERWWRGSCTSLLQSIQTLTAFITCDPSLSLVLLSDKFSLSALIQLCALKGPECVSENETRDVIADSESSTIVLLTALCTSSGPHFEDFERLALSHRSILFPILIRWLDVKIELKLKGLAIEFLVKFFTICCAKEKEGKERSHLRNLWGDASSQYAMSLSQKLARLVKLTTRADERIAYLTCCDIMLRFLKTSKHFLEEDLIGILVNILRIYGTKVIEVSHQYEKDQLTREEIKWVLLVMSTMFHQDMDSRKEAVSKQFASILHTTRIASLSTIKNSDRTLLHVLVETLVNFTNEFPEGAHSLSVTTGIIGVSSRKTAGPTSLLGEILSILQNEFDLIEFNSNLSTVDLIMPLLNNIAFSPDCRNIVMKTNIPAFLQNLQYKNVKKWNFKQQHIKLAFMQFLLHMSVHPEVQSYIAKTDDAVSILIQLAESDTHPSSMMALEILRNLCFHSKNRARLLTDPEFLPLLSHRISTSESLLEIRCSAVALWARVSNCERGKVAAKASSCGISIADSIAKLRKRRTGSQQEEEEVASLVSLLEKLADILNAPVEYKL